MTSPIRDRIAQAPGKAQAPCDIVENMSGRGLTDFKKYQAHLRQERAKKAKEKRDLDRRIMEVQKNNDVVASTIEPDSALLEPCPHCGVRALVKCKGGRTHIARIQARDEREELMHEHRAERAKRRANAKRAREKKQSEKYVIYGTKAPADDTK